MKKTKIILTIFFAALGLLFVSCERDITEPTISANPTKPIQTDFTLTTNFDKANAESPITFAWSAADFGFASSITYTLQLSSKTDFSADVVNLISTPLFTGTSSVKQINNYLLAWGKVAGTETTLYYRVAASVTTTTVVYSDVKSKNLIPFKLQLSPDEYTVYYVPGKYQGWSHGEENGRIYSYNADSKFENIIRITPTAEQNGEFKITPAANWDTDWGGTLTKSGNNYSGTMVVKGDNFKVDPATYKINIDVTALTITLTKTDDWGIIGSAIPPYDWSKDVDMFYNGKLQMWEIIGDFKAGEFKFRANDDWTDDYGDDGNKNGVLKYKGENITLAADGNYTIRFDPVKLAYTVKKN